MIDFLWSLGPWSWVLAAVVLVALEFVVPGVHFIWFGLAAAIVGLLTFATGITWPWQLVAFVGVAVVMVLAIRRLANPDLITTDEPDLNVRGAQYVGRTLTVEEPITGGRGKVRVGDTLWPASGPDAPRGAHVRVVGVAGTVLEVEAA